MFRGFDNGEAWLHAGWMKRRSFLLLPFLATAARAHSLKVGDIKIGHAWALPAPIAQDGQCFMPMLNTGREADAVVAARSDICSFVELRENARYDHPAAERFELLPNKPFAMRPQAVHLRLAGLNSDLVVGQSFSLILDFLNQGEVEVEVVVEKEGGH
jgi:periplasmic copper chaperone A